MERGQTPQRGGRLISCHLRSLKTPCSAPQPQMPGQLTAHNKKFWGQVCLGSLWHGLGTVSAA